MYVIIRTTTLVWVLFGVAIPTSPFNLCKINVFIFEYIKHGSQGFIDENYLSSRTIAQEQGYFSSMNPVLHQTCHYDYAHSFITSL